MKIVRHALSVLSNLATRERELKEEEAAKPMKDRQSHEELVDTVFEDRREVDLVMNKINENTKTK